ncbi:PLDc_N domain-containing protein [Arachnia propionica]|uniref:PLDc_N domain-containing protein n=1 Tax=Arachnia propionica TaxID=1750 RepID=A0A3P1T2X2_9ACTN|nr:PLD nuclease N-terminal domain-containing protein [Arachnia propionica]MDO5083330.1 PLD nuclease N-terminal domain-containing protein [Arachnia propionica]RRD03821.1 PLDc_N domain-containing protein [Arachnia propionica]
MLRILVYVAAIALSVYCLVDLSQSREDRVRLMPRAAWALAFIFAPVIGPLGWFFAGRPVRQPRPPRPKGPDDDDDFLRGLR